MNVRLQFEAASVLSVNDDVVGIRPKRIGWLIKSIEVDSASIRYRCFHFTRGLARQFDNR